MDETRNPEKAPPGAPGRPAWVARMSQTLDELEELGRLEKVPATLLSTHERQTLSVLRGVRCPRCGALVYPAFPQRTVCDDCLSEVRAADRTTSDTMWFSEMLNRIRENRRKKEAK